MYKTQNFIYTMQFFCKVTAQTFSYKSLRCFKILQKVAFPRIAAYRSPSLSYNITGESAPIIFQSKKCPRKHGGFQHLLTPIGSSGSEYLPLTNRDPSLKISPSPPSFCTIFYLFLPRFSLQLFCKVEETAPERLFYLTEDETI